MASAGRKPKDRDFLRTQEGMFFCVTGYLHPPDRYTAYLKYSPDPSGKWRDSDTAYRRELSYYHVRNVASTISYLEKHYPQYIHYCPVRDICFSMVPREYVDTYYDPQRRLQEILAGPRDSLEEEICTLVAHLEQAAGIPSAAFGVTGSVLIYLHNPAFSDIDLLIFGQESALKLRALLQANALNIRQPGPEFIIPWFRRIAERFGLTLDEAAYLAQRRWNYGFVGRRYLSIHAVRTDREITENYGDRIYRGRGAAKVKAIVVDASEALYLPAVYRVDRVARLEGDPDAVDVEEIVSYEAIYCDVADVGQEIEVQGKLETVNGEPRRLVIGTTELAGRGYIKAWHE
jgi:predicted nucleotidyltransferase